MEPWLPRIVWYDNLDVLGSDFYQQAPGLHAEPNIVGEQLLELFIRAYDTDVAALIQWARDYEASGYPGAAQAMRDRASAITTPLDATLMPFEREQAQWYLQFESRPSMLLVVARSYEAKGFPRTGSAMRDRAALLRIARRRRIPAPEIVWPWPNATP